MLERNEREQAGGIRKRDQHIKIAFGFLFLTHVRTENTQRIDLILLFQRREVLLQHLAKVLNTSSGLIHFPFTNIEAQ